MAEETMGEMPAKKKSGLVVTAVAVLAVTVIGGVGGWFVGKMLAPAVEPPKVEKAEDAAAPQGGDKKDEGLPKLATEENGVVQLEPITTNLAYPTDRWVRLEVALLFKQKPDVKLAEAIQQDIAVYLRTVSLQQIEGPRGFQYLKEDLEERADMISEGKVERLMFRTFVIQ
ncbi:flagellar basal body-associated FliL family protein [Rhizobium sp.]